jgi:4-hydroxythreonine-4-phosphate dehydrogenase
MLHGGFFSAQQSKLRKRLLVKNNNPHPVLAITPGEPAGIGPEITLKLVRDHPDLSILAIADPECLKRASSSTCAEVKILEWAPGQVVTPGVLNCLPLTLPRKEQAGLPDPANAVYVLDSLRSAVNLVQTGVADALVTGPVNKAVINQAGIVFSGHTEFLADLAGVDQVVMMLAAPGLRVALVTTHLPLRQVADAITASRLDKILRITIKELQQRFGITTPRLQILGLNPHAGEGGYLGNEDDEIIRPVIEQCRSEQAILDGPIPADTAFNPPRLAECDAVIAMYHDQGLPVLKHFGFGRSVNITLGLPFIRTSVDHGTALDIAGKGMADASSIYHAARMAADLASRADP